MNIIRVAKGRIEAALRENKNTIKTYKSDLTAETKAEVIAQMAADHFSSREWDKTAPCNYIIIELDDGRYTPIFDLTGLLNRHDTSGGYLGLIASQGYYSY